MPEGRTETRVFPFAAAAPWADAFFWVIVAGPALLVGVLFALTAAFADGRPVPAGVYVVPLTLMPLLAVGGWLLFRFRPTPTRAWFEVGPSGLRVVSPFYGRAFAREAIKLDEARVVDLKHDRGLRPLYSAGKMLGINMPGTCTGTYRLANGSTGLLYLAFPSAGPAVYLPVAEGPPLLLSPSDPEGLLAALRAM